VIQQLALQNFRKILEISKLPEYEFVRGCRIFMVDNLLRERALSRALSLYPARARYLSSLSDSLEFFISPH
jgi:hypothetical protein